MEFEQILGRFEIKRRYENRAQAICPCHADKEASLTISRGRTGTLLCCHAGCSYTAILEAAGLKKGDLFYTPKTNDNWRGYVERREGRKIEAVYNYVSCNGDYAFSKIRLVGKKMLYGILEDRKFIYGLHGRSRQEFKALYGDLEALNKAISDGTPIFIPEGEKDVNTLKKRGYTAVTYGGVNDWNSQLAILFRGAIIYILGDNDSPGLAVANRIKNDLEGIAKSTKIIIPTPDILKGDVTDFFQAGHTDEDFRQLLEAENTAVTDKKTCGSSPSLVDKLVAIDAAHNYPTNDIGSANLFSAIFSDMHRYNSTAKDWFYYNGKNWTLDREGLKARNSAKLLSKALTKYAVNHVPDSDEKLKENYLKYALTWTNYRVRNAIIQDSRDANFITNEMLDNDDYILNLPNCVLRFNGEKVERLEHSAGLLLSKMANAEYQPGAKCERWERFLDEVMEGDTAKIHYLQKLFGMALTGDCSQEKMWFLHGSTTRNGKSTLVEIIANVLGDYARTIKPESLAIRNNPDSRQASPDIAKLQNIRLCICSEIPKRMPLDTGLLKTLTGRDTIVARHLHQEEFEFKPKFKLICNTNYLPTTSDTTVFKSDRLQVISFDRHFSEGEQDKHLKDKLSTKEAMSGILGWLISGWVDYCREGLEPPETIRKATTEYAAASDKLQNFINDCLTPSEGKNVTIKESYSRYEKWCQENGFHTENKRNFMEDCKSKGIYKERGMVDGVQARNIIIGYIFPENDFVKAEGNVPFT